MIELKDVKSELVIGYKIDKKVLELLMQCDNVSDVEKMIKKYSQYNWDDTKKRIIKIKKTLIEANDKGVLKQVYSTKGYSEASLIEQDKKNNGEILILNNIISRYHSLFNEIQNMSISQIKELLRYTDEYGNNYLVKILHSVGDKQLNTLLGALNLYEEQIERQSLLTKRRDINLFRLDEDKKKVLVYLNLNKILEYLSDHTSLIWSDLSINQQELYRKAMRSKNSQSVLIRDNVIRNVVNYTTLPEVEELDEGNMKILNRFIKC